MLNTVIKGCKTVAEFKKVRDTMERLTSECSEKHKRAFNVWTHGEPVRAWFAHADKLGIEYEDGSYWHYNSRGEWF